VPRGAARAVAMPRYWRWGWSWRAHAPTWARERWITPSTITQAAMRVASRAAKMALQAGLRAFGLPGHRAQARRRGVGLKHPTDF
jgi:hypothetical protein